MTHRSVRRAYQGFSLAVFVGLWAVARTGWIRGWPVDLFFHLDPLLAFATILSSRTLHGALAWSLVVVVGTLFVGRVFCGWVCPLGSLNDAVGSLRRREGVAQARANAPLPLFAAKYVVLAAFLVAASLGSLLVGLIDPLSLLARGLQALVGPVLAACGVALFTHGPRFPAGALHAALLASVLVVNVAVPRFWCRALCPLGALLGLLSRWVPFGIRRDRAACTACGLCERSCNGAASPSTNVRRAECIVCMNCRTACPEGAIAFGRLWRTVPERRPPDVPGRRVALGALAGLLAWPVLRAGSPPPDGPSPRRIRPPGARPEPEFLARCARCGMCARACPTGVIRLAAGEAGLEGLWTPVLRFDVGYCEVSCVLCGHVCPTGAIEPLTPARKQGKEAPDQAPARVGTAFYDWGRCLPWAMDTPCVVCEEVCPVSPKAIWTREVTVTRRDGSTVTLKRPYVDPSLCIGCGICEYHCPVEDLPAIRVSAIGESRGRPLLLPQGLARALQTRGLQQP